MYIFLLIVSILQITLCRLHRETQVIFKMKQKDGCSMYTDRHGIPFKQFIQETYFYVDKTLLLKELMSSNITNILITAPKKFGKSINLRMMEFFLEMQPTENLSMIPPEQTNAYKFFVNGRTISSHGLNMDTRLTPVPMQEIRFNKPPLISKYPDFIAENLAQYAVIYLNIADFGPAFTFDEFFMNFKCTVSKIFKRHKHTREAMEKKLQGMKGRVNQMEAGLVDNLLNSETKHFDRFLDIKDQNRDEWTTSVVYLCELMAEYYKRKVIILMDNHDYMIKMMGYMEKSQRNLVAEFLLDFTEDTFVFNPNLYKCIATGVFPMVQRDMARSGANDFVYFGNVFNEMHPYYGFTKSEFNVIAERLRTSEVLHEDAEIQYDGYFNHTIINPFDLSNFLNTYSLSNWWAQENNVDIVDPHIETNSSRHIAIRRLLHDQCIPLNDIPTFPILFSTDDNNLLASIWMDRESIEVEHRVDANSTDDLLMYMLVKGIVTVDKVTDGLCARVPNEEAKQVIRFRFPRPNSFTGKDSDSSDYSIYHPEF